MSFEQEINKRRTFGIISHPDAGKTTLTEKLLLFGGAIKTAGAVKSNKIKDHAKSDFMEIEKQRGISVATSVMGFEYKDVKINLLDTPGHKDFAEDTYRTLTAVDSVVMVIDCVKGVEEQTQKLMEVCRMRNTPVICFINKLDREGQDPYDLLDEVESKLNIKVRPLSWPINMGKSFKGVYSLYDKDLILFQASRRELNNDTLKVEDINDPELENIIGENDADQLREDVDLIESVYSDFNVQDYLDGKVAPVFFGSAVNNFGVRELLDTFIRIAPNPKPRETDLREVSPFESKFTGFVFKIHANMDPKHRNRIAFLRICSGKFERTKAYTHVRQDKKFKFSNATAFMAQQKETIDEAFPGDIIGLYDTGNLKIGDTLTDGEKATYKGIPSFSPEIFKEVINKDAMKTKQLEKGLKQLMEEGVAQMFVYEMGSRKVIGTVGALQFEVIQHRLKHEYGATCDFVPLNMYKACWISCDDRKKLDEFVKSKYRHIAQDKDGKLVFMAETRAWLQMVQDNFPDINFHFTSEFE
ncbi:peptide chain release factor 3 [Aureibacter tunicatorum]|uniref:Peptide chain release factor 3 n=1 Tax=Aureibacter tunicatorum TaxID=866807 RepID=A0AAE3XR28_9BACT|nr:peptide chain release factor 3 [Aureibacter tunicatorum]MDR6240360.1 peptide chain release factor 3 [Aureibacter tunicatorum]BDD05759.1 peptide chain release factor 3 [Aureibacter tunicatorum]